MKKILYNPPAFFMLVALIVTICVVLIPLIVRSVKDSQVKKGLAAGRVCSACGEEAVRLVPAADRPYYYYCEKCFDAEYGNVPTATFPGLFD